MSKSQMFWWRALGFVLWTGNVAFGVYNTITGNYLMAIFSTICAAVLTITLIEQERRM